MDAFWEWVALGSLYSIKSAVLGLALAFAATQGAQAATCGTGNKLVTLDVAISYECGFNDEGDTHDFFGKTYSKGASVFFTDEPTDGGAGTWAVKTTIAVKSIIVYLKQGTTPPRTGWSSRPIGR
jgi:hypothetical protein